MARHAYGLNKTYVSCFAISVNYLSGIYINPTETGFYYLYGRYYDPEVGRFLNADDTGLLITSLSAMTDKNLFVYCDNNPISRKDENVRFWNIAAGAIIGAVISGATQVLANVISGDEWHKGVLVASVTGAASGALSASGLGKWGQAFANAAISSAGEIVNQWKSKTLLTGDGVISILKAGGSGFIGGLIGGNGMRYNSSNYYKAAQSAKTTAQKVFGKTYSNPNTPIKLLARAANNVKRVGIRESWKTGGKFVTSCINAQILTRECPYGIITTNRKSPVFQGFSVIRQGFSSFSNPKNQAAK